MSRQVVSLFFGFLFVVFFAKMGFAQDANDVAFNITNSVSSLPGLVAALSYLVGLILAVRGIFKTIEHVTISNTSGNYVFPRVPLAYFLAGGLLFSLPIVIEAAQTTINGGSISPFTIQAETLSRLNNFFSGINVYLSIGTNINTVFDNITSSIDQFPALVSATAYLLGLLIVASAVLKTKDHVEEPSRTTIKEPAIRYLLAGALFALPTVYSAMYNTITDGGLGTGGTIASFVAGFSFLFSSETNSLECVTAYLGALSVFLPGTTGLGQVICNAMQNASGFPIFLTSISYLIGLVFGIWGLFKIRDHVVDPTRTGLNEGVMRLLAGGAFFAFPYLTVIFRTTLLPIPLVALTTVTTNTGYNESLPLLACNTILSGLGFGSGPSLDQAMSCFMNDILGPTHVVLNFFATVAGMIFIMIGISRLIKSSQEGARGPGGIGTIGTFVVGGLLLSATTILRAVSSSMFVSPVTQTFASMRYTTGMSVAETQAAHNVISAVLKFMLIIGMISFVRGIFIMRDVAEGKQQASSMSGITHIIGGALAVNLGPLLNAVQASLGVTAFGVSFGGL